MKAAVLLLVLATSVAASAQIPDFPWVEILDGPAEPAMVFAGPDGSVGDLTEAWSRLSGATIDATITVQILDGAGNPIANYPFEDIWLQSTLGGMVPCNGGTVSDVDTDGDGITAFSGPLLVGGGMDASAGEVLEVCLNGMTWPQSVVDVVVLTADLNGDLMVNLTDTIDFAALYLSGGYAPAIDFLWDGEINLSDLVIFAGALNTACP